MASEDKTYCGEGERDWDIQLNDAALQALAQKLGVSRQDILDVIAQVGADPKAIETFFHDKENSY